MTLLHRALLTVKLPARPVTVRGWTPRRTVQARVGGRRYDSSQSSPKPERPPATPKDTAAGPKEAKESKSEEPIDVPSQLWYRRLGPVTEFFGWFHRTQTKRPLTVQLTTTLITYLCGDLLAQEIGREEYQGSRTLRMLAIGGIASVPGYKW